MGNEKSYGLGYSPTIHHQIHQQLASKNPRLSVSNSQFDLPRSADDMAPRQLDSYLSGFYLIKTPYGFVLGRKSPSLSTTTFARRASKKRSPKGEF